MILFSELKIMDTDSKQIVSSKKLLISTVVGYHNKLPPKLDQGS